MCVCVFVFKICSAVSSCSLSASLLGLHAGLSQDLPKALDAGYTEILKVCCAN